MMHNQYLIIILLIMFLLIWLSRNTNKIFVIRIRPARVTVIKGHVTNKLIEDCKDIIRNQRVYGYVWGIRQGTELQLRYSKSLDEVFRQRFRNIFPFSSYKYVNGHDPTDDSKRKRI